MRSTSRFAYGLLAMLMGACSSGSIAFNPAPLDQLTRLERDRPLPPGYDLVAEGRLSIRGSRDQGTANFILYLSPQASLIRLRHPLGPSMAEALLEDRGLTLYLPREKSTQFMQAHPLFPQRLPPRILRQILWGGGLEQSPQWKQRGASWEWEGLSLRYQLKDRQGQPRKIRLEAGGYRLILLVRKLKVGRLSALELSPEGKKALAAAP